MISKRRQSNAHHDPFVIKEGSLKYGNFEGKFRRDWVEDSFTPAERGEETVGNRLANSSIAIGRIVIVILLLILSGRLLWLQVVRGAYYRDVANGNRLRLERIEASRGIIYDANNQPLVHNVATFLLYCTPADLPKDIGERDALIDHLAALAGNFDPAEIKKQLNAISPAEFEYYQPLFIVDNIAYDQALKLYLESFSTPGIVLTSKNQRNYELSSLSLSHVLGYTGNISQEELDKNRSDYSPIDYLGKVGLEKSWESELRGVPGVKQVEVNALGKEKKVVSETASQAGHNLLLSLDATAQKKLEEIMASHLHKAGLKRAAAVVMNPQNGEIVSLISLPSFDNNIFARGISQNEYKALADSPDQPLFNRSVAGEYPAGSTIKPVVAAMALEEGVISGATSILSVGGLRVGQWVFPDWKAGGHGASDVRKAIAESVNTFFYYIGGGYEDFQGLGIDRMVSYFRKFLLGETLGIDLPHESKGFVPTKDWKEATKKESWYIGDTYHVAIGQGDLLATPLQIAAYTSFFANGGTMYRPHLVKEITAADGQSVRKIEATVLAQNIISQSNIEIVRQGMRQTVSSGSARSLSSLPVSAAGKTGTAQFSSKKDPHAWFTGFAPYDDPQLVITILVEEGKEGSAIASPIAREFFQWYFGEYRKK